MIYASQRGKMTNNVGAMTRKGGGTYEERRQERRLRLRGPDQELRGPGGTGPHPDHRVQEGHSEDGQRPPDRQEVTEIE